MDPGCSQRRSPQATTTTDTATSTPSTSSGRRERGSGGGLDGVHRGEGWGQENLQQRHRLISELALPIGTTDKGSSTSTSIRTSLALASATATVTAEDDQVE